MLVRIVDEAINRIPRLEETAGQLKDVLHQGVLRGGTPLRKVADFLHGTWLGHPLHPVLTDITIGAWALGVFFDAVADNFAFAMGTDRRQRVNGTFETIKSMDLPLDRNNKCLVVVIPAMFANGHRALP